MKTMYAVWLKTNNLEWVTATCNSPEEAQSYIDALELGLSPDFAKRVGVSEILTDEPAWRDWAGTKQSPRVDPVETER